MDATSQAITYAMSDHDVPCEITDQQIDLWEHATLLYHNYEWQAAAHQFVEIARRLEDAKLRSFCFLNTVMILARLGDYETASSYVKLATQEKVTTSITAFLAGAVTCELNDRSFAAHCFEYCWQDLSAGKAMDFSEVGLNFILNPAMALHNMGQAKSSEQPASMYHIPAELIFEAPKRYNASIAGEKSRRGHSSVRRFSRVIENKTALTRLATLRSSEELLPFTSRPALSAVPAPLHIPPRRDQVHADRQLMEARSSNSTDSGPFETLQQPQQRRAKTPYTPREARVSQKKRMSLADFIRKAGHKSDEDSDLSNHQTGPVTRQPNRMVARNPHGEYESTKELSNFANDYVPRTSFSEPSAPFTLGQRKLHERQTILMTGRTNDRQQWEAMRRLPPTPNIPPVHTGTQLSSQRADSATSCVPTEEVTLEMLQPAVYRPVAKKNAQDRRDSIHHHSEPTYSLIDSSCSQTHTAGKSSFEKFKSEERARALDALEGKVAPSMPNDHQSLLPWELGRSRPDVPDAPTTQTYSPPSPVPTLNFFEAAIHGRMR